MEIGIDCVDICRFEGIGKNKKLLEKIFTKSEVEYCEKNKPSSQHFAVRFAAKEAVIKGLANYGVIIAPNEIEITRDKHGRPSVKLSIKTKIKFEIKISLTHSQDIAISQVLISENE